MALSHCFQGSIYVLVTLTFGLVYSQYSSTFTRGQFEPTKGKSIASESEFEQCRGIRDVIKRNTARYRKVLVRNDNFKINFGNNEDNRYMTSRAKSKLDFLASRVQAKWGSYVKLQVDKAWTDVVDKNDMLSLHYEGRTVQLRVSDGDRGKLGQLCGLALEAGFDWVYYQSYDFIRVSVIPDVCQTKLDLAFVVDSSGSVGSRNYQTVKESLKSMVDFYNVGLDQTRIALVSYSYSVYKEFYLSQCDSKSRLKTAIDNLRYEGSNTATGDALMIMKNYIFKAHNGMRNDNSIPKIGILITDGKSNRGTSVSYAAQQVRNAGISMFVIGVGTNLRISELNQVASDPDDKHVFLLKNGFRDLSGFVDQMSTTSCDEGAQLSKCESAATYVDGGSFKYFRGSFAAGTTKVTIELQDHLGKSYLYTSLVNKNPGPLDRTGTTKNTNVISPRATTVDLTHLSTKLVYISVQGQEDRNQFDLSIWDSLFKQDRYDATLMENLGANQHVKTITSNKAGTFRYEIKHGNTANHFKIDQWTGRITTTTALNREAISQYSLVINALDTRLICHKGRTQLVVTVGDQNDNSPKFNQNPYTFYVREDASLSQLVGVVSATDKDIGVNGRLRYSILSGSGKDDFSLDANTGQVRVRRKLDFERQTGYSLRIQVQDGGSPQKTDVADLVINIQNINEPPNFIGDCSSGCSVSIAEGNAVNRPVKKLSATDPDTTKQCTLKYRIVSSDSYYFKIHETSGDISTQRAIDRERKEVYSLHVEVKDCDNPPLKDKVIVTVRATDINDNKPQFPVSKYTATVLENQPSNTQVTTVKATDLDVGTNARITYAITAGNPAGKFKINGASGLISTQRPLDRESKDKYQLTISARDGGSPQQSNSVIVDINVGDVNDNDPEFYGSTRFNVVENAGRGTYVNQVQTRDRDSGLNGKVRCSIASGNIGNAFSIDVSTCRITTVGVIDRESRGSYSLSIQAADLGRPSRTKRATYTIDIGDVNDNSPIFTSTTYRATVKENSAINANVVQVRATDRDAGTNAAVTYSITSGDDSQKKFRIDRNSGQIKLINALSFGVRNSYQLKVKAQDGGPQPRSGTSDVTIIVEDTNDYTPVFNPASYTKNVAENAATGTSILKVTATDQDSGPSGQISYSIQSGNSRNSFVINSQTGELKINRNLDREAVDRYTIKVKAKDNGSPSRETTADVSITITDINDNRPEFTKNPFRYSVSENAANDVSIGQLSAGDRDIGTNAQLEYKGWTNGKPISVTKSGLVKVSGAIDYEITKQYTISVQVTDKGNPPLTADSQVVIQVQDKNDNRPQFANSYKCEILENSPASTVVCYVVATDADSGNNAKLRYLIAATGGGTCPFSIDSTTAKVSSTQRLDRESTTSFNCKVIASDLGAPSQQADKTITITVKDENDNAPVANPSKYTFRITEEQTSSLSLGSIAATDRDIGDNAKLSYTLIGSADVKRKFRVAGSTGAVTAAGKLDREQMASYLFTVRVSDNGRPSLKVDAPVKVIVNDINDNTPVFSRTAYSGRIAENSAIGSNIVQVMATDLDAGTNAEITYEITGGMHKGNFSINPKTGLITTARALDYETLAKYELTVTARDGATSPKSSTVKVTVNVINLDDNAPDFGTITEARVSEGSVVGTPVVKFNAKDADGGTLTYSIKGGNTGNAFEVHTSTGQLRTRAALDRETIARYNLTVAVKDQSNKETIAHLPIKITDINDNAPVFSKKEYKDSIFENAAADNSILRVFASDRDEGTNAEIEYEITSGPTKDSFKIESGDLKTTRTLDREKHATHRLIVTAKDKGTPSLRGTAVVIVTVKDKNDNSPVFDPLTAKQVTENCGVGATITVVSATDPDDGTNGQVKYKIKTENGGAPTAIQIDEANGVVTTKTDLDRETTATYTLIITASDSATVAKSTEATLSITVVDENDNAPTFKSPASIPPVKENIAVNTVIATFVAEDRDTGVNAQVEFEIVSGNVGGVFGLNKGTGVLSVMKALDREQTASYSLTVKVQDKGQPALRNIKKYNITVEDINDNGPIFSMSKYKAAIDENVSTGQRILIVKATDLDQGANAAITYSFSSTATAATFSIDGSSGLITTKANLDYETKNNYKFKVTATDGKFSKEADVEIDVRNLNDNDPIFERVYVTSILESKPVTSSVITVKANDKDSFGSLSYSLLNNTATFSINSQTGQIETTVGLDREKVKSYVIGVKVEDGGIPSRAARTTVTVNVGDVNDNAPYFSNTSAKVDVPENKLVNAFHAVKAMDNDIGINAQLTYEIVAGVGSDKFSVHPTTGAVSTAAKLDRENSASYTINIVAKDKGNPSLTSQPFVLSVSVTDENDNAPLFLKSHNETISEGTAVGTDVFEVLTSDQDIGINAEIVYSFGSGNAGNVFKIHNATGVVSVNNALDRETVDKYSLEIIATDRGTPSKSTSIKASIKITDENDNAPKFIESTLKGQVYENEAAGASVVTVRATDADLGENARLEFSLNSNDAFSINAVTGEVKTLKSLDREETNQYTLSVTATDHGAVPLSTTKQLVIRILDKDDNCPVFSKLVYTVKGVGEDWPRGTIILNVTATDRDEGTNAELRYAIKAGDDKGAFTVDSQTGAVKINGEVDREYRSVYHLKVRAGEIDCGLKPDNNSNVGEGGSERTSNGSLADVYIHVTDVNDNAPVFKKDLTYEFNDFKLKDLMNITATDPDTGAGGEVKFRFLSSKRSIKAGKETREVLVEASDNGNPSLNSTATVLVRNKEVCHKMSFTVSPTGLLSATTLCEFKKTPIGEHKKLVGDSFKFECEAVGNEDVFYKWQKDGSSVQAPSKETFLNINPVTKNDEGVYECLASNGAGNAFAPTKATLLVEEKPRILGHPQDQTAEIGGDVKFYCKATGDPTPRYQWRKDGEIYQAGEGFETDTLFLPNVIMNDKGEYVCEAVNPVGIATSHVATLKVFERNTVVSLKVRVNNPKKDGSCHFFDPTKFQEIINKATKKKVSVTDYDKSKLCVPTACEPSPCGANGEKCEITNSTTRGFFCSCKGGWKGDTCMEDINECNTTTTCQTGTCNNVEGSYWCSCPSGKTGHDCKYDTSACAVNPCKATEVCLPSDQSSAVKYICVAKEHKFKVTMKMGKKANWEHFVKYVVAENLNQALNNWKPLKTRKRRSTNIVEFNLCTVRATNFKEVGNGRVEVEYVLICPNDTSKRIPAYTEYLCNSMLEATGGAEICERNGAVMTTKKPTKAVPSVEIDLKLVVRNTKNSDPLSATEAKDIINKRDVRDALANNKITVDKVEEAYGNKQHKKEKGSGSVGLIAAIAAVAFVALIIVAVLVVRKRRNSDKAGSHITMTERLAQRGQSKQDLLRSDIMMTSVYNNSNSTNVAMPAGCCDDAEARRKTQRKTVNHSTDHMGSSNNGYAADRSSHVPIDESFMINVAGQIKAPVKKAEQYESLPWYKGQLEKKQVESNFEQCTKPGSYMAYKTSDEQLRLAVKCPEGGHGILHLDISRTSAGGFSVKCGNTEPVTRDSLIDIIEHYQISAINLGDGSPEIVLTEPWMRTSI